MPSIPERLLLAHARGEVLFVAGAGVSLPAGLPDFRRLVIDVYEKLDSAIHAVVTSSPDEEEGDISGLTNRQIAEVRRFKRRDYDVALGMLERRLDDEPSKESKVRSAIAEILRSPRTKHAPIHRALMRLADRGGASAIVTTNFDVLLQQAAPRTSRSFLTTYAMGAIPRPSRRPDFSGVMHIHGVLDANPKKFSDMIVTDQDFGEFYLHRRSIPDLIYDAARLYHLVLVGYSADDPPMRYLLHAIAADGSRFDDLKERFTFVGVKTADPIAVEDWNGRGITPVPYDSKDGHIALLKLLNRWSALSANLGDSRHADAELRRIVNSTRPNATEADQDLFDHLVRRGSPAERVRISGLISKCGADWSWLDSIRAICVERDGRDDR